MVFRFSLQPLLRLQDSLEKAEFQRLEAATARVEEARLKVAMLDQEMEGLRERARQAAATGVTGAELRFGTLSEEAYQTTRARLMTALVECEKARYTQLQRYTEARRQREIVNNMRQAQLAAFEVKQSRRAQQETDELFLMRRGHKPSEDSQP